MATKMAATMKIRGGVVTTVGVSPVPVGTSKCMIVQIGEEGKIFRNQICAMFKHAIVNIICILLIGCYIYRFTATAMLQWVSYV